MARRLPPTPEQDTGVMPPPDTPVRAPPAKRPRVLNDETEGEPPVPANWLRPLEDGVLQVTARARMGANPKTQVNFL